jgi:hypothetical protein
MPAAAHAASRYQFNRPKPEKASRFERGSEPMLTVLYTGFARIAQADVFVAFLRASPIF